MKRRKEKKTRTSYAWSSDETLNAAKTEEIFIADDDTTQILYVQKTY